MGRARNSLSNQTSNQAFIKIFIGVSGFRLSIAEFGDQNDGRHGLERIWILAKWDGKYQGIPTIEKIFFKRYDDEENDLDEPTKGDLYGYIQDGVFYGATEEAKMAYICEYNIQEECDLAAEAEDN